MKDLIDIQELYFNQTLNIYLDNNLINEKIYQFYINNNLEKFNYSKKYHTIFNDISFSFINNNSINLELFLKQCNIYLNSMFIRLYFNPKLKDNFLIEILKNYLKNPRFIIYKKKINTELKKIKIDNIDIQKINNIIEIQLENTFFNLNDIIGAFDEINNSVLNKEYKFLEKKDNQFFLNFSSGIKKEDLYFFRLKNHNLFINQSDIKFDKFYKKIKKRNTTIDKEFSFIPPSNSELKYKFYFKFMFLFEKNKLNYFPQTLLFFNKGKK